MRRLAVPLLAVLALSAPASALASGDDVLRDCNDDEQLSKRYTQKEYREALDNIPADIRQYTNCQAVIRRAQLAAAGSSGSGGSDGGGSGGGGSVGGGGTGIDDGTGGGPSDEETLAAATPEQKRELAEAATDTPAPVTLPGGGPALDPASAGEVPDFGSLGELPTPLGVLLVLMVAGAAALGINRVRHRVGGPRAS